MSNRLPKTDVVIVGLGAAGGVASHVLTQAGIDVVAIEAGPRLDKTDFLKLYDELSGLTLNTMGNPKANNETPTWRKNASSPTQPWPGTSGMMNAVGGTSVHYGALHYRFLEDDWRIKSSTIEKYGEEAIPEGSSIVDWPVDAEEMEPYYTDLEKLIGVSGEAGANPFEAARSSEFPLPPLQPAGYPEMVRNATVELGHNPFTIPAAVLSEEYKGRSACTYCGHCAGFGCWNDAKSSTHVSAIAEAEQTGKLEIRTNSRVTKILSNDKGQVTGVEYIDENGDLQEQSAGVVVLSSYIYENIRLMLLSSSQYYKAGLGNNHGQLGKHYMSHSYVLANGYFPGKELNNFGGLNAQGVAFDDFNGDNFDHSGLGFIRGSVLEAYTNYLPITVSGNVPPSVPQWGAEYTNWLQENGRSVAYMFGQPEPLSYDANFLDLDPDVKDPLGMPVIRVTYDTYENEHRMVEFLADKMEKVLKAAGAVETWSYPPSPLAVGVHTYGGARMGNDPAMSVVDRYGLSHEASNLAVLGGAVFNNASGYPPTPTIQALAWRTAEHIAKNFDDIAI